MGSSPSERRALRERWLSTDGELLREAAIAWLVSGAHSDPPADLGRIGGRVDLRGLPMPAPALQGVTTTGYSHGATIKIMGARWSGLDLSGANLEHLRFHEAEITDCLFNGGEAADLRLWRSSVTDCSFAGADLRQAVLGTWLEGRGNTWRRVSFDGADLRKAVMAGGVLDGCTFVTTRLVGVWFTQMALTDCVFVGPLRRVVFDGRARREIPEPDPMTRVDFRAAVFRDVAFRGCRVRNVRWPESQETRVVERFRKIARRAVGLLEGDTSRNARKLVAILEPHVKAPGGPDSVGVFVWDNYIAMGGLDFAKFVWAALDAAEGQTG